MQTIFGLEYQPFWIIVAVPALVALFGIWYELRKMRKNAEITSCLSTMGTFDDDVYDERLK